MELPNPRHELFAQTLLKLRTGATGAYMQVYPKAKYNSARHSASLLLTNVYIKQRIYELLEQNGLGLHEVIKKLSEFMNCKYPGGHLSAHRISDIGSNGRTILAELIKKGVVEDMDSYNIRLKPNLDQKESIVREIAKDKFDEIWALLLPHQGGGPNRDRQYQGLILALRLYSSLLKPETVICATPEEADQLKQIINGPKEIQEKQDNGTTLP